MLGTYASAALILVAAALVGQAVFALVGHRRWSWLSPAVGLGLLIAIAWGTVRLPGEGTAALAAVGVAALVSVAVLRGRVGGLAEAAPIGVPVAALALIATSLPSIVEGHFGILGTGLNPDMSQHLFAADRLLAGDSEPLIEQGYPLGPHSLVVAIAGPTDIDLVQAFNGLTLAIAVCACLAALAALEGLTSGRRILGALLVGLPYMAASFLIQGAFKETIEALFVLAFAVGLQRLAKEQEGGRLRSLPLAALAIGAAYAYSFPGLLWLLGAAAVWALVELALVIRRTSLRSAAEVMQRVARVAVLPAAVAAIAIAPEAGRIVDFAGFETFDPDGAGLGNLFNPISPLEALGIWPSGDFRLDPGDGAMPALGYWVGGAVGLAALGYGAWWWLRRRELAVPSALAAAALLYLYALLAGTPYQESKAIAIAAPLAMLIAVRPLLTETAPGVTARRPSPVLAGLALAFLGAAAGSTILALVNGPVGPTGYSPALAELRPELRQGSTLVLAPSRLLDEEHGRDFLVWELRGNRICVGPIPGDSPPASGPERPRDVARVVVVGRDPVAPEDLDEAASVSGGGPCPLITDSQRAEPGAE